MTKYGDLKGTLKTTEIKIKKKTKAKEKIEKFIIFCTFSISKKKSSNNLFTRKNFNDNLSTDDP